MTAPAHDTAPASPDAWGDAYLRFETPAQEIRKFQRRLLRIGAASWPRDARIVELFCGRGNGLNALAGLGFTRVQGLDLSLRLVAEYEGSCTVSVADCRAMPLADASVDVAIVQGGLHHLPVLPDDLDRTLAEVRRVLAPGGRFVAVEPWRTPFLDVVHWWCDRRVARRAWPKLDALATMIEHERDTYDAWLGQPRLVLGVLRRWFPSARVRTGWGKVEVVAAVS